MRLIKNPVGQEKLITTPEPQKHNIFFFVYGCNKEDCKTEVQSFASNALGGKLMPKYIVLASSVDSSQEREKCSRLLLGG